MSSVQHRTDDPTSTGSVPNLLPHHLEMLTTGSGLSAAIITERGYRSVTRDEAIEAGFAPYQARAGLLIPLHNVRGERAGYSLRPDVPRSHRNGKTAKYEQPKGSVPILDVPLRCREMLDDPAIPLDLTEGAKKVDSLADRGACAINLSGVWNWRGTNRKGGKTVLADWDSVALNGRKVQIIFDSDVATKPEVGTALRRLKAVLESRGEPTSDVDERERGHG